MFCGSVPTLSWVELTREEYERLFDFYDNSSHLVAICVREYIKVFRVVGGGQHFFSCHDLLDLVERGLLFFFLNPFGFGASHICEGLEDLYALNIHVFIIVYHPDELS